MTGFDGDAEIWIGRAARLLSRWCSPVTLFLALLVVLSALYVHDRGFDMTDEAYYVLSASQPDRITAYISPQHWILAPLWKISGDLAKFRLVGLLALILSSAILSRGLVAAANRIALPSGPVAFNSAFACSLIGAVLYLTTINLSPSYNLMASIGCYAAIGLALLAGTQRQAALAILLSLLAGLVLTVEFASKPSSGMSTFLLLSLFLWAASHHLGKTLGLWLMVGGGFAVSLVGLALLQGPWPETQAALRAGYRLFRVVQSEPILSRLLRYAEEYLSYLLGMIVVFLPFLAALAYFLFRPKVRSASLCLLSMLGTLVLGRHLLGGSHTQPEQFARQIGALLVMVLMSVLLARKAATQDRRLAALVAGLFLAPYSVAVGTGNAIFTQVIDSLAPWGALIAFLPAATGKDAHRLLSTATTLIFAATATSQIVTSVFRDAYHLSAPFFAQTQMVDVGALGQLRLDSATADFVSDLKAAASHCQIPPGATYLGLYNNPGLALVLQAETVTSPWINNLEQAEILLPRERLAPHANVIVARNINSEGNWPALPVALANLETEYRLCGTATYPFATQRMEIWFKSE